MNEGHTLDHGHQTDIVSGKPVEEEQEGQREKQLAELRDREAKHDAVVKDLRSGQGRQAIEKIHQALDNRVQELVQKDPTARALMSILQSFDSEVVAARQIREYVESLQRRIESR